MQGVDLLEYVYNLPKYTEKDASSLIAQLFDGLNYLHSLSIVHRHVKPTSIIVRVVLLSKLITYCRTCIEVLLTMFFELDRG